MSINCIPLLVYLFSCRFQKFDDDFVFRNLGIIFDNLMTLIYKLYIFVFEPRGVLETTVCDKVCQWLATGRWFSLGPPISSTNKTDHHDIAQIPMKVASDTKKNQTCAGFFFFFCSRVPTVYLLFLQRMYTCFFPNWYVILQSSLDEVMTI